MAYYYKESTLPMTGLYITYNCGGMFDQEGQKGCSHLMEHLVCKTFKKYYPELTRNLIDWNAYTSNEIVCVHFTGMEKYFTSAFKKKIVNALIGGINISEKEFESEKKVVLQEYMDSFNNPEAGENILRNKYNMFGAIGKFDDVANFTYKDMQDFYEKFMKKPAKIIEIATEKTDFSYVEMNEDYVVEPMIIKYKNNYNNPVEELPSNSKSTVLFLNKKTVNKKDFPYLTVALQMLGVGLESPMTKQIREKKHLTYGIDIGTINLQKQAIPYAEATTDKKNEQKLINEFTTFFNNPSAYLKKNRFDDVIRAITISREKQELFPWTNVGKYIRDGYVMIGDTYKTMTFEQVKVIADKYLNIKNFDIIVH